MAKSNGRFFASWGSAGEVALPPPYPLSVFSGTEIKRLGILHLFSKQRDYVSLDAVTYFARKPLKLET